MTPKERASKLLEDFNNIDKTIFPYYKDAKNYASFIIDDMLEWYSDDYDDSYYSKFRYDYWKQVQKEIEKL